MTGRTVALQGLFVLQDPASVDQPLLLRRDVAFLDEGSLEGADGGIEGVLYGELGPVGAPDLEGDGVRVASAVGVPVGAHERRAEEDRIHSKDR